MLFTYTAISKTGKRESATIEAQSPALAGHMLKEQGLLLTQIKAKADRSIIGFLKNISSVSLGEKIGFIENLGVMLKAGISISRSLQILAKQTKNLRFKNILNDILSKVESGKSLAESLALYPTVFTDIIINMVKVGEMSGNLDKSLEYLTTQLHREEDLKSKVKGAMIYPSVIMGAMLIIGVLMGIFVLPKLTSIFKEFNTTLPPITIAVMAIADFMSNNGVLVMVLMVAFVFFIIGALKTQNGQRVLDFVLLHFFMINPVVKKINLARFSRILSSLLKSGVPIVQGLEIAGNSLGNVFYKELVFKASTEVRVGKSLTDSLGSDTNLFPVLVVQMLKVGEESGAVQEILEQLAMHYEEDVDVTLRNVSSIIEPLLLLFIGGVVGILAMALISPIYNISESIS